MQAQPGEQQQYRQDSAKIFQLLDSVKEKAYINYVEVMDIALRIRDLCHKYDDRRLEARSEGLLGAVLSIQKNDSVQRLSAGHMKKSLALFRTLGDSSNVQRNYNNLMAMYIRTGNDSQALEYGLTSLKLLKHLNPAESDQKMGTTHYNLGICFYNLNLLDSSEAHVKKARTYLDNTGHPFYYMATSLLGLNYLLQGKREEGFLLLRRAYQESKKTKYREVFGTTAYNLAVFYYLRQDYEKSAHYLHEALKSNEHHHRTRLYLAVSYFNNDRIDSASYYLKLVSPQALDLGEQVDYYKYKGDILKHHGLNDQAIINHTIFYSLRDSLKRLPVAARGVEVLLADEMKRQNQQVSDHQKLLEKKEFWLWIIMAGAIGLILTTVFAIYYVKRSREKVRQNLKWVEEEKTLLERQMEASKTEIRLKEERIAGISEILEKVKAETEHVKLKDEISQAQYLIQGNLRVSNLWEEFFTHFERVHPDFLQGLKTHYNLSVHDLRLCAFIKMDLSNNEIANLLRINPESVHMATYRLKKKLKLAKEARVSEFIANF